MDGELELKRVPPQAVPEVWPLVRGLLKRSVERGLGRVALDDIVLGALMGRYELWIVGSPGEGTLGVGVSEFLRYPDKTILSMFIYSGERRRAMRLWPIVEEYARSRGCAEVQIAGPRAWGRIFREYEERFIVFTKAVC